MSVIKYIFAFIQDKSLVDLKCKRFLLFQIKYSTFCFLPESAMPYMHLTVVRPILAETE